MVYSHFCIFRKRWVKMCVAFEVRAALWNIFVAPPAQLISFDIMLCYSEQQTHSVRSVWRYSLSLAVKVQTGDIHRIMSNLLLFVSPLAGVRVLSAFPGKPGLPALHGQTLRWPEVCLAGNPPPFLSWKDAVCEIQHASKPLYINKLNSSLNHCRTWLYSYTHKILTWFFSFCFTFLMFNMLLTSYKLNMLQW